MTHDLIASDRVEGTAVFRASGEKIGVVQRLMIDKLSGKIVYTILKFGGVFGLGGSHCPVPWTALRYNLQRRAYEADITEEQIRNASSYIEDQEFDWGNRSEEVVIHKIYRSPHYWE